MPLKVHWGIMVSIHRESDNPLENTAEKWKPVGNLMPLNKSIGTCHWRSTTLSEVSSSGVQASAPSQGPEDGSQLGSASSETSLCSCAGKMLRSQRTVIFPMDVYWNCPMDFQWHVPMGIPGVQSFAPGQVHVRRRLQVRRSGRRQPRTEPLRPPPPRPCSC